MRNLTGLVLAAVVLLGMGWRGTLAQAEELTLETSGLLIYNVWVRPSAAALEAGATPEPPLPGTVSGAYMTIENTSETDYALVGVDTGVAEMTHVHETTRNGEMMGMRMVRAVEIPAGATVLLDTGGYHAMLMNLTRDIHPDEAVPLTLTFEDGSGARFETVVAALATDFAPEERGMIAANAQATWSEDGTTLNVTLVLINRGTEAETLERVTSDVGAAEVEATEIAAGEAQAVVVRLSETDETAGEAHTLALEFASGTRTIVGVATSSVSEESR